MYIEHFKAKMLYFLAINVEEALILIGNIFFIKAILIQNNVNKQT